MAAPFRVGMKELYLPDFTVVLKRTPHLPASCASFIVPLWFSKLDLRDYLYHAYNVRTHAIRSYVKQSRVVPKQFGERPVRRWHRPRAKKHMTVELEQPFVWPDEPTDLSPWNKKERTMGDEQLSKFQQTLAPTADQLVPEERRKSMREQAKALLEGREKWKPQANRI